MLARGSSLLQTRPSWSQLVTTRPSPRRVIVVLAQNPGESNGSMEDLFSEELKRRGMSVDSLDGDDELIKPKNVVPKDPFTKSAAQPSSSSSSSGGSSSATRMQPRSAVSSADGQRERSMAMVTEGLEGLPGRAAELLKLGGTFFLAFAPGIVVLSILFSVIYLNYGSAFIHGGVEHSAPPHYDVDRLLSEPTVDPYIGF